MRLRVTLQAKNDVDQIHDHIALDKPSAARRWLQRMRQQFKFLAKNPGVGEARDDLRPQLRGVSVGNYVVFFRVSGEVLEIVRVVHGARDVGQLF
jgi:toxin ParE1/3/4